MFDGLTISKESIMNAEMLEEAKRNKHSGKIVGKKVETYNR